MRLAKNEVGALNILLAPLIIASLLFLATFGFAFWAYAGMKDYKVNVDQKVDTAVKIAVAKNSTEKDNEFLEMEKQPTLTYRGSAVLGSITFQYPKTWSGYQKETDKDMSLIMQQRIVEEGAKSLYPLRVEVLNTAYDTNVKTYESFVKSGKLTASPFRLQNLPIILGTRFDGEFTSVNGGVIKGTVILLPQREKTIKISTEYVENLGDLNNIILPSFSFTP